jgi:ribosome-associated toxin RatA of RatAB toxin-antitoxin module
MEAMLVRALSSIRMRPDIRFTDAFASCETAMPRSVVLLPLSFACMMGLMSSSVNVARAEDPVSAPSLKALVVKPDPGGGVRAIASLLFPGSPALLQSILSDYRNWPQLFETRMRLANLEDHAGRVITDLYISHALLPGEQRLLCESQSLPGGGLVTDLMDGDFKRYHRVWKLLPAGDGNQTRAEFELLIEVETIVPDWLVAVAMERELNAHFRIVREKALDRITKGK